MLTDVQVRKAKPAEQPFKLADAGGLHLYITPAGGKLWRYRYRVDGKEKLLSLGAYPALSLAEARQARDKAKADQREGRDPAIVKRQARHRIALENAETFEVVAREWHELQKPVWSKHHAWDVLNSLETDVFPAIGRMPIRQVTSPDILHLVRKVERRGAIETGRRIRQRVSAVFDFARSTSRATEDALKDSLLSVENKMIGMAENSAIDALFGKSGGTGGGLLGGSISSLFSGLLGHNAEGTGDWRGGPTWVGERGPEIVNLPTHATVVPNAAAAAMAGSAKSAAAAPQNFNFNIVTPSPQAFAASQGQMAAVLARAAQQGTRNG